MNTNSLLNRVERACAELCQTDHPITFTAIATKTGVSRSTLYRQQALRTLIEHQRQQAATGGPLTGLTDDIATLTAAVETLAKRVQQHEQQLRKLRKT